MDKHPQSDQIDSLPENELPVPLSGTQPGAAQQVIPEGPATNRFRKFLSNKKLVIPLILVLLLVAGTTVYFLAIKQPSKQTGANSSGAVQIKLPPATSVISSTYFETAKKLSDQHIFKNQDAFGQTCTGVDSDGQANGCGPTVSLSDISYYQVGTTKDNKKIFVVEVPDGIDTWTFFALGNPDGSIDVLAQMSDIIAKYSDTYKPSFSSNVRINDNLKLTDITFPLTVTVNGQNLAAENNWNNRTDKLTIADAMFMTGGQSSIRGAFYGELKFGAPQKMSSKDGVDYYQVITNDDPTFKVIEIYGTYNNLFSVPYSLAGEIVSTKGDLKMNWSGGEKNTSTYFSGGQGCGSRGYVVANNINKADLVTVGKTPKGQPLYQLPTANALVQEIYNKDYAKGENLDDKNLKDLSVQQMTDKHAYFLAQNGLGEYELFQRDDMFVRGGCAKPVIYLYPEQVQQVSVNVGAQVTKSEPLYPTGGWHNVTAAPDGLLTYDKRQYSSLYWEGYGEGAYPDISSGTIVKSADAAATVRSQLAQQGLEQKEIADFMAYWQPKFTSTGKPYVRISWLGTGQMNQLAPLHISPTPKTTIRVFMDFEGLDKPYNLATPNFEALKRNGFTVVEWGGLLRNGLNN